MKTGSRPVRVLTVGHSYSLRGLRKLPDYLAQAGGDAWEITAVGPSYYRGNIRHGDLSAAHLVVEPGERARVAGMPMHLTHNSHFAFWGRAMRELERRSFDVVHVWEEPFNPSTCQLARWARGDAVFCFSTYQNLVKRYPQPYAWFERTVLGRADGWIGGGALVEEAMLQRPGYGAIPHATIGMGVDVGQFAPDEADRAERRALLGFAGDVPVVAYVGRFVEAKGIGTVTRALEAQTADWRALFLGAGDDHEVVDAFARRHPDRVKVLAAVPFSDVPSILRASDVLFAPSRTTPTWREQFGRVLVEAFASETAVLTSDSGEIPRVVGDAAVVVGENDQAGFTAALERLITDPRARAGLARRGLERVHATFAWPIVAEEHLAFFRRLLDARSQGA